MSSLSNFGRDPTFPSFHPQTYLIADLYLLFPQLKEFVLNQPEAYEVKIGDQVFRRPGDPPFELLLEKLQKERDAADNASPIEDDGHGKDEL